MKLQNLSKIISLVLIFVSLLYHGLCTHSLLPQNSSTFLFDKVIIRVGIILDMEAWTGKSIHSFINFAISDFYTRNSNYRTRIVLHIRDSKGDPLQALSAGMISFYCPVFSYVRVSIECVTFFIHVIVITLLQII
ncbi:hypothetical protein HanXRQr2_Chr01g0020901 [Helianthus annuus]|uniref:Periplasmic binding protein-like I n=1 Tax=Helianthus annuus TaxID=4232 RepID=A0A9K3P308_HELAN|nr:hypothetical protein HanXRQr2_Chr01g0020901 [Helianthus annuus]KAJ0622610.1 hypothetical protein HanIR_Chr01g0022581 [Helianthus annuus]KAJ0626858.1 hypothetical protein HanHA89_Chr01g0018751 [Helianthus annuus]